MPFENMTCQVVPERPLKEYRFLKPEELDSLEVQIDWQEIAGVDREDVKHVINEVRALRRKLGEAQMTLGWIQYEALMAEFALDETDDNCHEAIVRLKQIQNWASGEELPPGSGR